jgi:hypothetical protein
MNLKLLTAAAVLSTAIAAPAFAQPTHESRQDKNIRL